MQKQPVSTGLVICYDPSQPVGSRIYFEPDNRDLTRDKHAATQAPTHAATQASFRSDAERPQNESQTNYL